MNDKPSALTRAKAAIRFYRDGWKHFQLTERKSVPYRWPMWRLGQPQWPLVDYQSYAQEGFNENAVIFAAIMYKVRAITAAPLRAYSGKAEKPELLPADHPLTQVVTRPNRYQSQSEFQGLAEVYLNLSGNCYIYMDRETPALWLLRPDLVRIVPYEGKKELMGFLYIPEGMTQENAVPFLPQDVAHIRLPNPLDPLDGLGYGLAPLSPAARSASVDNEVTRYLKLFFEQGAMPPGLLKYDIPLDDSDVSRAKERWKEMYGGVDNWTDIAVLDQGGEYQRLGLSFDEMGFGPIDERNEARMAMVFGVPPILIGTRLGLTRSSYGKAYEEARKAFWEDTMTPELRMFEVEYQYYLQGDDGEFVAFDLSRVPALSPTTTEQQQAARDAFQRGAITRNEYRHALHLDPVPGGNVYLVSINTAEVQALQEPEPTSAGAPEAEEQAKGQSTKREILAIVNKAGKEALKSRQTIEWEKVLLEVQGVIPPNGNVRAIFQQAADEGWSVEAMANRLEKELK